MSLFIAALLSLLLGAGLSQADGSCQAVSNVHLTNYGFPDASGQTQFVCDGSTAKAGNVNTPLGDGTYNNPYAFATSNVSTTFAYCETIYVPYLHKYFKFIDTCIQCYSDVGQHPCEMQFGNFGGSSYEVIRNPGPNMQHCGQALYDQSTQKCYNNPADGGLFIADISNREGCTGAGTPVHNDPSIFGGGAVGSAVSSAVSGPTPVVQSSAGNNGGGIPQPTSSTSSSSVNNGQAPGPTPFVGQPTPVTSATSSSTSQTWRDDWGQHN